MVDEPIKGEGEENPIENNPIMMRIKDKEKKKKENPVAVDKGRGEVLEEMYSAEGKSRATERQREAAEKEQYFSTSMRLTLADLKRFNDAAFKVKTMRRTLTYDDVFTLGLDYLESMSSTELLQFVMRKKTRTTKQ